MNEEIKNQMLLNSDSYEFFLKETREAERNFFKHSGKCIKHIQQVSEIAEDEGGVPSSRINIKKFKKAREAGEQFLVISKKFVTEMEMMKKLSQNIFDSDLDVPEAKRFELFENYGLTLERKKRVNVCFWKEEEGIMSLADCQSDENCDECVKMEFCPTTGNNFDLGDGGLYCIQETEKEYH